MQNKIMKALSLFLVLVLLANMLPMSSMAAMYRENRQQKQANAPISAGELTADAELLTQPVELTDKRTEFTKEFRLPGGTHMAMVYPEAVHYQTDQGWAEIDNTLKATTDGGYTNTAGVWDVRFPEKLEGSNRIAVTKDGYTLQLGMAGALHSDPSAEKMEAGEETLSIRAEADVTAQGEAAVSVTAAQGAKAQVQIIDYTAEKAAAEYEEQIPDKLHSRLSYANVYNNTNVAYDLQSNQVKESVILRSYDSALRGYRFTLQTAGMLPVLREDGHIDLYGKDGKTLVMVIAAPFLVDAKLEICRDVEVSLTGANGSYTLTYLLPMDWLAEEERTYPVILDPTITAQATTTNILDASVAERSSSQNYTSGVLNCGYASNIGAMRSFVQYGVLPTITSSDVILEAEIKMYKALYSGTSGVIEVHKVEDTWESPTIQWHNKPKHNEIVEDYVTVQAEGWYTWNVTDIVRDWYENENTGMMFKAIDSMETATVDNYKQFYSSDYGSKKPTLTIKFRNTNGVEGYWDYTSVSAGRAGSGMVNNFNGNLVWTRPDVGFGGNRMSVSISHVYNLNDSIVPSDDTNSNDTGGNYFGMGNGWRTTYNQRCYLWNKEQDKLYYIWEDEDGTDHYFIYTEPYTLVDETGSGMVLKTDGSGATRFRIIDKDNTIVRYFDNSYRLTKIENNQATKDSVTITYLSSTSPKIATVTDAVGRVYTYEYNDAGMLSGIKVTATDPDKEDNNINGVMVTYTYDSNNNLTSVTDKDGACIFYTYDNNNNLISVKDADEKSITYDSNGNALTQVEDIDGYRVEFSYNTPTHTWQPYRVTTVSEHHNEANGSSITFRYDHNQTTVTDNLGNVSVMQFNRFGNLVSIQDDQGNAQFADYAKKTDTDGKKGNQLTAASKLQNTVSNLLSDSSFESGTLWSTNGTVAIANTGYLGSKSLRLTDSNATAWSESFTVPAGKSYTFSAWVKAHYGKVTIGLCGTEDTTLLASKDTESATWTRLEVNYTNNSDFPVTLRAAFFVEEDGSIDCAQVEASPTASRYNLMENGDFRNSTSGWTGSGAVTVLTDGNTDSPTVLAAPAKQLEEHALRMDGVPTQQLRLSQTVNVSGSAGDTYVVGGWAKGDSVPLGTKANKKVEFGIQAVIHYTDGTTKEFVTQFNPDMSSPLKSSRPNAITDPESDDGLPSNIECPTWQYTATAIVAEKAYSSITVRLVYDYNMNSVAFDGIQLFKEQFCNSYTYDDDGNVISVQDLQAQTTEYEYDENNDLVKQILPTGAEMTYTYDDYHNVLTATSATGLCYSFTYDEYGNNTSVSIAHEGLSYTASATYKDGDFVATTTDAAGNVTEYGYDRAAGVLKWVKYPEDQHPENENLDTPTTYTYDEMYRLATAEMTTNTDVTFSAEYTYEDDYLTAIQTPTANYSFTYGNFGLRSSVKVGDRTLANYTYNSNNLLQKLDYGNDDYVQYTYDSKGRLMNREWEDGATVTYHYDTTGALAAVTDEATGITTTWYYDLTDRLIETVEVGQGYHHSVAYTYDNINNLTKVVETINGEEKTTTYTYDDDNRIVTASTDSGTVTYTYDDLGRISGRNVSGGSGSGFTLDIDYQFVGWAEEEQVGSNTSSQVSRVDSYTSQTWQTNTYTYDDNGNITAFFEELTDINIGNYLGGNTIKYTYDSANQLVREDNYNGNFTHVWVYDNAGNILSRTEYPYTTGTIDQSRKIRTVAYGYDEDWGDLLRSYGGQEIDYDDIGNPEQIGNRTLEWKHGRQLATLTEGETTWTYTYNSDGLRTKKTNGTTTYTYVYNGSQLSQMTVGNAVLTFSYDASGIPVSVVLDDGNTTATYYYIVNLQGDVTGLATAAGEQIVSYFYDAWGNPLSDSDLTAGTIGALNPLRYRGYVYDSETELYYLQSRYYDPEMGRFLNADGYNTTGQGFVGNNMYTYCLNNPVNLFDPTGNTAVGNLSLDEETKKLVIEGLALVATFLGKSIAIFVPVLLCGGSQNSAADIEIDVAATAKTKPDPRIYTVYYLCKSDSFSRQIVYVGRVKTANYQQRLRYHKTMERSPVSHIDYLTYEECRALEQIGMMYYHTINRGDPVFNQINGIGPRNRMATEYYKSLFPFLQSRNGFIGVPESYIQNFIENEMLNGGM